MLGWRTGGLRFFREDRPKQGHCENKDSHWNMHLSHSCQHAHTAPQWHHSHLLCTAFSTLNYIKFRILSIVLDITDKSRHFQMQGVPVYREPTQQCFPEGRCNPAGELQSHAPARASPGCCWASTSLGDRACRVSPGAQAGQDFTPCGEQGSQGSWVPPRTHITGWWRGRSKGKPV